MSERQNHVYDAEWPRSFYWFFSAVFIVEALVLLLVYAF